MRQYAGFLVMALAWSATLGGEVLDRTVAVVGPQTITASEVELQLRLEALFDERPAPDHEDGMAALQRVIDQHLIADDVRLSGLAGPSEEEREAAFAQIRQDGFGDLSFTEALERYGVAESQTLDFLLRQLEFLRYVDLRFRTGQVISDEEVARRYRRRYGAETTDSLQVQEEQALMVEGRRGELRRAAVEERVENLLDERIKELRAATRIVILDPIPTEAGDGAPEGQRQ